MSTYTIPVNVYQCIHVLLRQCLPMYTCITTSMFTNVYMHYYANVYQCIHALLRQCLPMCTCITTSMFTNVYMHYYVNVYQCIHALLRQCLPMCTCITTHNCVMRENILPPNKSMYKSIILLPTFSISKPCNVRAQMHICQII